MQRWILVLIARAVVAIVTMAGHAAAFGLEKGIETLHHPVPGGIAIVTIDSAEGAAPTATYRDRPVLIVPAGPNRWFAIVGIPLDTPPSTQTLKVKTREGSRVFSFAVADRKYREQHLTIKNQRHVNPNQDDLKRIRSEMDLQNAAYRQFSPEQPSNVLFDKPVQGPLSSPFGLKRFFNGEARAPHSGLDFAVGTGTPIRSPAAGRVILTGNYFFNGNTVFVDHGQGLISMFCHLSVIDVSPGDKLERGQILGKVGATGRVTGAHLHWNVSLNDARIDPAILIGSYKP